MENKHLCRYCWKYYKDPSEARKCENTHDVIFVPFIREDLNRLVNFIATGNRQLLTERMSTTLFKYFRVIVDE